MGTISDKLMRIINTKEDIRQALISKGYDVPTSIPFKEYAKMISDLPCRVDSFPDIEGIVARYSALGLTNEQMAANPVWVDKTGNGHDLQMKNFAWNGMSGAGGYVGDFSKWVNNRDTTEIGITKSNSKVIIDVKVSQGSGKNIVFIRKSNLGISNNITIKITSTYPEGVMKFANSASKKYLKLPSNGITTLQDNPEYTSKEMYLHLASADLGQITIEQLPLYPGALVFDGVDDYGTCENFPILTKEKGYTVAVLKQWLSFRDIGYPTLVVNSTERKAAFSFEDFKNESKSTWNWGKNVELSDYKIPLLYTYQTSTSYNSKTIHAGATEEGSNILQVCRAGGYCANAAIWEIVILDHDATEEELTKIKDYFIKTYPWLFPDQAWTVVGKTNEDEDRATIANITGNGNNLVLSNFGFAEGSGYNEEGEYAGYLVTDGVDDIASSNTIIYEADFTFIGEWKFIQKDDTVAGINSSSHLYIQNRYNRGATVMINSTFENKKNITDYMTFKAITSKGKAYDENWNEVDLLYGDGNKGTSGVNIGGQGGTEFCHMIFKNMALYMNKVFSKDDCIKAYNYLQTLKAK